MSIFLTCIFILRIILLPFPLYLYFNFCRLLLQRQMFHHNLRSLLIFLPLSQLILSISRLIQSIISLFISPPFVLYVIGSIALVNFFISGLSLVIERVLSIIYVTNYENIHNGKPLIAIVLYGIQIIFSILLTFCYYLKLFPPYVVYSIITFLIVLTTIFFCFLPSLTKRELKNSYRSNNRTSIPISHKYQFTDNWNSSKTMRYLISFTLLSSFIFFLLYLLTAEVIRGMEFNLIISEILYILLFVNVIASFAIPLWNRVPLRFLVYFTPRGVIGDISTVSQSTTVTNCLGEKIHFEDKNMETKAYFEALNKIMRHNVTEFVSQFINDSSNVLPYVLYPIKIFSIMVSFIDLFSFFLFCRVVSRRKFGHHNLRTLILIEFFFNDFLIMIRCLVELLQLLGEENYWIYYFLIMTIDISLLIIVMSSVVFTIERIIATYWPAKYNQLCINIPLVSIYLVTPQFFLRLPSISTGIYLSEKRFRNFSISNRFSMSENIKMAKMLRILITYSACFLLSAVIFYTISFHLVGIEAKYLLKEVFYLFLVLHFFIQLIICCYYHPDLRKEISNLLTGSRIIDQGKERELRSVTGAVLSWDPEEQKEIYFKNLSMQWASVSA